MKRSNRRTPALAVLALLSLLLLFAGSLHGGETKYTCPMHPHYISDTFGTCPICGMDLVEVEAGDGAGGQADDGLHLPAHLIQHTGVRSRAAEIAYFGRSIRSFGEVAVNQRLQSDISLRGEGWIEELVVNAEGDEVAANSLLFRFYSPQLVSAQQDFLTALSTGNGGRIKATEDRLHSLGVQPDVIKQIAKAGKPFRAIPYYAGQRGRVENIAVRQGSYLRPGAIAMRIQGYDQVWIQVNLAEQDVSFVKPESRVDVDFPNLGIHRENVTIDYIAPTVDPATRTAQLRLILDNQEGTIRPGAYVDVTIMTDISPRLAIPYESVLQNKEGSYVILERGDGAFQAREIKIGMQYRGLVEVQAGLAEGDMVVVSGQFLIDSESSLRESFARMEKMALSLAELSVDENQLVLLNHLVEGTIAVHEALTAGNLPMPQSLDAAEQAGHKLAHEVKGSRLAFVVDDYLTAIQNRNEIMTVSGWQQLLSQTTAALQPWIIEGRPRYYLELGLSLYTISDGRGWVQFAGTMQNPYGTGNQARDQLAENVEDHSREQGHDQ